MRVYLDTRGRFTIGIPDHWICREEDTANGNPVTFDLGDKSDDYFQISCFSTNQGIVSKVGHHYVENKYSDSPIVFLRRVIHIADMVTTVFEAKVEGHFILVTHITSKKQIHSKTTKKHLHQIERTLEKLRVVNPSSWAYVSTHAKYNRFMVSLLAAIDLTNKAQENGSSIELVILYANQIDAHLRLALILQEQLQNSTDNIDATLIFQGKTDKPIFEKEIYERALNQGVIEKSLYERLKNLYELRNGVVHRYIISDLKTNDIVKLVVDYMDIHEILGKKLSALEQEQFEKNIGIYGGGNNPTNPIEITQMRGLLTELKEKHNNAQIIKEMTIKVEANNSRSSKPNEK
ncbi:MAG: hypothetical protein NTZ13_02160 [Candidatus Parcubacteria bacterium]|nr:hypothetical protein [Candidatus Parcubacteria bacterium]